MMPMRPSMTVSSGTLDGHFPPLILPMLMGTGMGSSRTSGFCALSGSLRARSSSSTAACTAMAFSSAETPS